jgi:diadenosine tetraphosphatase ApaH/serine/threonine PP2A family protein phosphatase
MRWTADQLDAPLARLIGEWPSTVRLHVEPLGDVLFCHATPRNDMDIFTRQTPADVLIPMFAATGAALVVCGHTHMQFDRVIGATRVVNAGSVGMPFQAPGAYWLTTGPDVELRRTTYDLDTAAARIRASGYPGAAEFADRQVLHPPGEEETLAALSKTQIR